MVSPGVLSSYEAADRIRSAMLDDAGHLRVSTVLRFIDMDSQISEVQLTIDGQTLRYAHGMTSPQRIDWNGQSTKLAIQMQLKSVDGRLSTLQFTGPWALFRFFGRGTGGGWNRGPSRKTVSDEHRDGSAGVAGVNGAVADLVGHVAVVQMSVVMQMVSKAPPALQLN